MKREIKFRVWDQERNCFTVPDGDSFKISHFYPCGIGGGTITFQGKYSQRFILQQFTGLKGFRDVEIYEGDIVEYGACGLGRPQGAVPYEENSAYWTKKEIVKWSTYGYGSIVPYTREFQDKSWGCDYRARVIGNILENPELVKEIDENNKNYPSAHFFSFSL